MYNSENAPHFVRAQIRPNKNLVFNKKEYPVDFTLMTQYSNYFFENKNQFDSLEKIDIPNEKIQITDDDFKNFVKCCQNQQFQLTDSNAFPLYILSIKYDVPDLKNHVNEYIDQNDENLIFQTIEFKLKCLADDDQKTVKIDLTEEESKIASNLLKHINNEQIFSLPIPVIYRILNKYSFNINELNQTNQDQVIEFLFKCLDKLGKEASILFLNLNLDNLKIEFYNRLYYNYSEKFDFNMLNPKYLIKTTNNLLSELNKLNTKYSNSIEELNKIIQSQNDQFKKQNDQIIQLKKMLEDQISSQNEAFTKTQNDVKNLIDQKLESLNSRLTQTENKVKNQIDQQLSSLNSKLRDTENSLKNQIDQKVSSLNSNIRNTENNLINRINSQSSSFTSKLSSTENSVKSYVQSNYITKNIQIEFIYQIPIYILFT